MTLQEAADNIGRGVIYSQYGDRAEYGVITSTNDRYVFVRYASDQHSKATAPDFLELAGAET